MHHVAYRAGARTSCKPAEEALVHPASPLGRFSSFRAKIVHSGEQYTSHQLQRQTLGVTVHTQARMLVSSRACSAPVTTPPRAPDRAIEPLTVS
ncbi:hypothetical protein CRG98_037172 [Punica granatum]|uniref:Uncharacterized protein n=1 Tax=Punica granatum TaxID=22663 RepID=A0A2I0IEM1_PUNGR|nr:hypothetical protein CRG98_037172 [Punica granatum]